MGVKTLQITQHDLQPFYFFQIKNSSGGVDLTGATLRVTMRNLTTAVRKIDRATDRHNLTSITTGVGQIEWQLGDTDVLGMYALEIEVTPSGAGKFTVPTRQVRALVEVIASQDNQ